MQWLNVTDIVLETTLRNGISLLVSYCGNGPGSKRNKNDFVGAQSWAKCIKQELTMKNRRANGAKLQVVLLARPLTDDNVSYMAWGGRQIRVLAHNKRPVCKWGQTLVPARISDCLRCRSGGPINTPGPDFTWRPPEGKYTLMCSHRHNMIDCFN